MVLPDTTKHWILMTLIAMASIAGDTEAFAKQRSAQDKALLQKATAECNGNHYPSGARAVINYSQGTFRCEEARGSNR